MVKRIVMMELMPGTETHFVDIFEAVKNEIRSQQGCMGLELLCSFNQEESTICTISLWQSVDDLETYRDSALFQKTWSEVRPFFSAKARAWTLTSISKIQ